MANQSSIVNSQQKKSIAIVQNYSRAPKSKRSDFGGRRKPNFLASRFQTVPILDVRDQPKHLVGPKSKTSENHTKPVQNQFRIQKYDAKPGWNRFCTQKFGSEIWQIRCIWMGQKRPKTEWNRFQTSFVFKIKTPNWFGTGLVQFLDVWAQTERKKNIRLSDDNFHLKSELFQT